MDIKNKNILVTGGSGFIGINLTQRLHNISIRATIHQTGPISFIYDDRIEYTKCDLLKMDDCKRVVKDIDYVFHCAANTSGAGVMTSTPLVQITPNIIMNSQLLEACYQEQIEKFIFISSCAAYPPLNSPVKEDDMFIGDPFPVYFGVGWMKRYTEKLCQLYTKLKDSIKTVVVRPANVYGQYDKYDPSKSHVMAATIRKVVERQNPIRIWGDGNDSRDFIYIDDFIDGLLLANQTENEVFNIASGINYTIRDILQIALEEEGYNDANIIYDNDKTRATIPKLAIDTVKAEQILGFKAKTNIREGIKRTIDWYKENLHNREI